MNHRVFDVRGLKLHALDRGEGRPSLLLHGWLDHAHSTLDAVVLEPYGWPADLPDTEILERLLALNLERAG